MGKYSDFPRHKHDEYLTPYEAALPLKPFLSGVRTFAEPCRADGRLIRWVESFGPLCIHDGDIQTGTNALTDPTLECLIVDAIITNPPYTWEVLSPMIDRFMRIAPTWLLLEADFKYNQRCQRFVRHCSDIVPIGRVRWIEDSAHDAKINYAWYRFHIQHTRWPVFHPVQDIDKRGIRKKRREGVLVV